MHLCDPNPSSCMWKGMAVSRFFSGNSGFLLHQWTPRNNMRANEISCSLCLQIVVHQLFLKSLNTNTSNINIPLHMACSFHYEMIQYLSILIITNWPFLRLCIKKNIKIDNSLIFCVQWLIQLVSHNNVSHQCTLKL